MAFVHRFAGRPDGDQYDSISFYSNSHFNGYEAFPVDDSYPRLHDTPRWANSLSRLMYYQCKGHNFPPRSIIVNGCTQWTLYDQENFQGKGTCTDRPQDTIADCRPFFYEAAEKVMAKFGPFIKSARKGCFVWFTLLPCPSCFIGGNNATWTFSWPLWRVDKLQGHNE